MHILGWILFGLVVGVGFVDVALRFLDAFLTSWALTFDVKLK